MLFCEGLFSFLTRFVVCFNLAYFPWMWPLWLMHPTYIAETWEEQGLQNYVCRGKLCKLPTAFQINRIFTPVVSNTRLWLRPKGRHGHYGSEAAQTGQLGKGKYMKQMLASIPHKTSSYMLLQGLCQLKQNLQGDNGYQCKFICHNVVTQLGSLSTRLDLDEAKPASWPGCRFLYSQP